MPRFSANLSMLFTEHDFLDRFAAAADAGFEAVEYISPYEHPAEAIAARLARYGLTQALFNMPVGDWQRGERGLAALPDRVEEFRQGVETVVRYATALGCGQVNCLAGMAPAGVPRETAEATFVDNLKFAADRCGEAGIRVLVEPINHVDVPGFFLSTRRQALGIIDRIGSDNLRLQYDIYHMQIMEGDLARNLEKTLGRIGHIQFADNPGRHEPGSGEINFPYLFDHLDRLGYAGWVGAEYHPTGRTDDSLGWFAPYATRGMPG